MLVHSISSNSFVVCKGIKKKDIHNSRQVYTYQLLKQSFYHWIIIIFAWSVKLMSSFKDYK